MAKFRFDIHAKYDDPREAPLYSIPIAAHYLQLPVATLRSWVLGREYPTKVAPKRFHPIIAPAPGSQHLLSFYGLAEAHVLSAVRRLHKIPLPKIRTAIGFVADKFGQRHPLIDARFATDGIDLFVMRLREVINASTPDQRVMQGYLKEHLHRIEWEGSSLPFRLYPFTGPSHTGPKTVLIDPRYSFGRPVLLKSRIPTISIAERYKGGESVAELAKDYDCEAGEIEEAVRCELRVKAA